MLPLARRENLLGVQAMAASAIGAGGWLARMAMPGRRGVLTDRCGPCLEAGDAGSVKGTASMAGKQTATSASIFGGDCIDLNGCKTPTCSGLKPSAWRISQEYCRWLADTLAKQEGGCNMVTS